MAEQVVILHIISDLSLIGNTQMGVQLNPDADLGFRMWGGKDASGFLSQWLSKDKPGRLAQLVLQDMAGGGNLAVYADNTGKFISAAKLPATLTQDHNDTNGVQGGIVGERNHLSNAELAIATTIPDHNDTLNIQGGAVGERNHLTDLELANTQLITVATTTPKLLDYATKMANGDLVNMVAYGDSTVDGNNTTLWSANPTSGGNAVGTTDHNITSPNGWPIKLRSILRDMFGNSNIQVSNCGYSAQRMDDGWAYDNYDAATTYPRVTWGIPDVAFIGFGINDTEVIGADVTNHMIELKKLVTKLINEGTTPVILSTDPIARKLPNNVRDNMDLVLGINAARKAYAEKLGLDFIDLNNGVKDWFTYNADGYQWGVLQDDGLHLTDDGKAFIAGLISSEIYNNTVIVGRNDGSTNYINAFDSRIGGDFQANAAQYLYANGRGSNNYAYQSLNAPVNQTIMTMWVWNENTDARLDYMGLDNEDVGPGATFPSIGIEGTIDGVNISKNIISAGHDSSLYSAHHRSDETFIHGFLPYGLSKVTYALGDSTSAFMGNFRIVPNADRNLMVRAIEEPVNRYYETGGSDNIIELFNDTVLSGKKDLGGFVDDAIVFHYKGDFEQETGIILTHGQGFNGVSSGVTNNLQEATLLYRDAADHLILYLVQWSKGGVPNTLNAIYDFGVLAWPIGGGVNSDEIRFRLYRNVDNQVISVYAGWEPNLAALTFASMDGTVAATTRWAGTVGGLWMSSTIAANKNIRVDKFYANLEDNGI